MTECSFIKLSFVIKIFVFVYFCLALYTGLTVTVSCACCHLRCIAKNSSERSNPSTGPLKKLFHYAIFQKFFHIFIH